LLIPETAEILSGDEFGAKRAAQQARITAKEPTISRKRGPSRRKEDRSSYGLEAEEVKRGRMKICYHRTLEASMSRALVVYYSRTGNTEKMAVRIAAVLNKSGFAADLKKVEETAPSDLLRYDLLVLGSPVYYGTMAWPLKKLLDESVKHHGRLKGKVGGAFTSSGNLAGGNETTVLDILKAMLVHGMIVQGDHRGDHFGPAAVGKPDARALRSCDQYAAKLAELTRRLFPDPVS
jgi:NAD(P)H dehydrogenase (quinone)